MTFFSASDFNIMKQWSSAELAANIANQKLQRDAKVVYGLKSTKLDDQFYFSESKDDADTHRALLICVEEIERKPCIHEAKIMVGTDNVYVDECIHCGKKLKPTSWTVCE